MNIEEKCTHGVEGRYCFNCKFVEKFGMPIEMFNNHHYVRLKHVEKAFSVCHSKLLKVVEAHKRIILSRGEEPSVEEEINSILEDIKTTLTNVFNQ